MLSLLRKTPCKRVSLQECCVSWVFKTGHIKKACRNKQRQTSGKGGKVEKVRSVNELDQDTTYNQPSDDRYADTYIV